jgi:hypothetical protein
VRVAPDTMRFTYTEDALVPLWDRLFGSQHIPSRSVLMTLAEFALRLQRLCGLPSVAYPGKREFYYMQSLMARGMLEDLDLAGPPFSALWRPKGLSLP